MDSKISERELHDCLQKWAAPLADANGCGVDVSFEPEFEVLKAEVEKETSLHTEGPTDWFVVFRLSTNILAATSKDIWAFAYGIIALCKIDGAQYCALGLECLTELLKREWDTAFPSPQRPQRRAAPLLWLFTRLEQHATSTCFMGDAPEAQLALYNACNALQSVLVERMGEDAPPFARIIQQNTEQVPGQAPPVDERDPSPSQETGKSGRTSLQLQDVLTRIEHEGRVPAAVLPQLIRTCIEQIRQLAGHLLATDVTDERAYTLHRVAVWGTLLQMPLAEADGKTQIQCAIPSDMLQAYAHGLDSKRYAEILPQLERSAGRAPFWLDGHYMVARCLEGLEATAAFNAIRHAFMQLVGRFPDIVSYSFRDGMPFASPRTQLWIESLNNSPISGIAVSATQSEEQNHTPDTLQDEKRLREAVALYRENDFAAGLRHLGSVPAGRSRMAIRHSLLQARYCLAAANKQAAINLLQGLYAKLVDWDLLDWEPELSAQILSLLLANQAKLHNSTMEAMAHQLHRLHLGMALGIFQKP
ncbi:MAG: type VI secretion system protein TssA [Betaproteobacteria bacterium]|nr:type VI secretion system protein TssA [Betaproteobacteria bacterium]